MGRIQPPGHWGDNPDTPVREHDLFCFPAVPVPEAEWQLNLLGLGQVREALAPTRTLNESFFLSG